MRETEGAEGAVRTARAALGLPVDTVLEERVRRGQLQHAEREDAERQQRDDGDGRHCCGGEV